ncbi:hypothetical protein BH11MYX3_BH11MYX3_16700 [soil metagenome]
MSPDPHALSAALEAALLRELSTQIAWQNHVRFAGKLVMPVLVLSETTRRLGQWHRATRTVELSRALVLARPWAEVISVLEHELAHQFVDEVLHIHDEAAHGPTFQRVCAERGIDGRAAGQPQASDAPAPAPKMEGGGFTPTPGNERALDRIRKLLALAGSPNQHEAEIAMRKAHELMLRHNIEDARARTQSDAYEVRQIGDPQRRGNRVEAEIAGLLAEYFFVKVIRVPVYLPLSGRRGQVYELAGTRANLEMACHVHAFLLATAERLWRANRGDARVRSGRDRLSYQAGVVGGFREKLGFERTELRGTGLVWLGDRGLDAYYRARHPRIEHRRRRVRFDGAHAAGREAGRTVVLHRPVETGPSGGTRLLRG